jgi:pimeloyl-ACP methyl ester carboxylesterase
MFRRLFLLLLPLTGCLRLLGAPVPMASLADTSPEAKCLLVLLPGVGDRAKSFREEGFVAALRERGISADVVAADATLGYYLRGVDAHRLDHDVIRPALARRYRQVWMAGISMGGFGTLHYASTFPLRLDGLVLLSPHLGEESVLQTIRDAGGLEAWAPPPAGGNYTERAWTWLKHVTYGQAAGPEVYLGYADTDTVVADATMLARALPASRVWHVEGGHTWRSWKRLWAEFLERSSFGVKCRAGDEQQKARGITAELDRGQHAGE